MAIFRLIFGNFSLGRVYNPYAHPSLTHGRIFGMPAGNEGFFQLIDPLGSWKRPKTKYLYLRIFQKSIFLFRGKILLKQLLIQDPTLEFSAHNFFLKIDRRKRTSPLDSSDFCAYIWIFINHWKIFLELEIQTFMKTIVFPGL